MKNEKSLLYQLQRFYSDMVNDGISHDNLKANLSFETFDKYIAELKSKGIVVPEKNVPIFGTGLIIKPILMRPDIAFAQTPTDKLVRVDILNID